MRTSFLVLPIVALLGCAGPPPAGDGQAPPASAESGGEADSSPSSARACLTDAESLAGALLPLADTNAVPDEAEAIDWSSPFAAWNDLQAEAYRAAPGSDESRSMWRYRLWSRGIGSLASLFEAGPWTIEEDAARTWLQVGAPPGPFMITVTREGECIRIAED